MMKEISNQGSAGFITSILALLEHTFSHWASCGAQNAELFVASSAVVSRPALPDPDLEHILVL